MATSDADTRGGGGTGDEEISSDMLVALIGELNEAGRALSGSEAEPLSTCDFAQQRQRIGSELRALELAVVADLNEQITENARLHRLLRGAEATLGSVQGTLDTFQMALKAIANQIESIRSQSGDITARLRNRKTAKDALGKTLSAFVIPPALVRTMMEGEINDEYCARLSELSRLLSPPDNVAKSEAYKDVCGVTALLSSLAGMRIRDFLYQQLLVLTRPGTNVQIIQQSVLDKYRQLNHFLVAHAPHFANEIRDNYVETMGPILQSYFVVYVGKLSTLYYSIGSKDDLLGTPSPAKKKGGAADSHRSRSSVFSLSNFNPTAQSSPQHATSRLQVLEQLDNPPIIPHVAEQHKLLFPYEHIFRSNLHLLVDTVCAEYLFDVRWFKGPTVTPESWRTVRQTIFSGLFTNTFSLLNDVLVEYLKNCFDLLGLLLMLRIIEHSRMVVQRRGLRLAKLGEFFDAQEGHIWSRFVELVELSIVNLRSYKQLTPLDTRPHFITRQYSELCASVALIAARDKKGDLPSVMKRLREAVEEVLVRLCIHLDTPLSRTVYLVNNYDLVVTVLREHERKGAGMNEDAARFLHLLEAQKVVFVENELHVHFPTIVSFAQQRAESLRLGRSETPDDFMVDGMIRAFNSSWKSDLRKIPTDILQYFPNFDLGNDILRQALGQFVVCYTQLEEAVRRLQRMRDASAVGGIAKSFIPLAAVTYEIKKITLA